MFITVGLFNSDSNLEMAVANIDEADVSIRLGNGDGTFTLPADSPPDVEVGNNPGSIALGFFNADSNRDMAVVNTFSNDVSIRLGNGDGTFTLPAESPPDVVVGSRPTSIAVGDFDNN